MANYGIIILITSIGSNSMYLKQTPQKSGRIYLSIVDNYYDRDKKYSRQYTVEKIGYLDALEKDFPDPIAHFSQRVELLKKLKAEKTAPILFEFFPDESIETEIQLRKNFGSAAISKIYHQLGIHSFIINRQRHSKEQFDANAILKMIVFGRLLFPASKKKTFEDREIFFENFDFSLDDVYRCLSFLAKHKDTLLIRIHDTIKGLYGRDTSLVYYDVTNYHFEIDGPEGYIHNKKGKDTHIPDGLRKKGVAKNHVPDPIVQMGLFMDNNGIPITYRLFPGNTNDCLTYRPNLSEIKREFGIGRSIVVADKGMTTGDNIWYTLSAKDGYVFSMSVRGAEKAIKDYVLSDEGYEWLGTEYKRKSRLSPRTIHVTATNGKKILKTVHEKQVVFYSEKYDRRAKAERAAVIAKAKDMLSHPGRYTRASSHGAAGYIKNIQFDKDTGEIMDTGKMLELDYDKLREEEKFDGYYMIITSEQQEKDDRIIEMYRGLWKIEESFRIIKSDLEARPVYVSTKEHIEAHFLTCFLALIIVRILELYTSNKYSAARILESLSKAECTLLKQNYYLFDYCNEILKELGIMLEIDFTKRIRSISEIKKVFADTKK